jgi:hypothetical protein
MVMPRRPHWLHIRLIPRGDIRLGSSATLAIQPVICCSRPQTHPGTAAEVALQIAQHTAAMSRFTAANRRWVALLRMAFVPIELASH